MRLTAGEDARNGTARDVDRDGDLDIFVATYHGHSVTIFVNDGGMLFRQRSITFDRDVFDVEVADVNRDSRWDLLVLRADHLSRGMPGFVDVFRGRGDGTFLAPTSHAVDNGPARLVTGDFNRDGHIDVATGNFSHPENTCGMLDGFASVTILPGQGDGTFTPGSTFALGNQRNTFATFHQRGDVHSLSAPDLDRDGHLDILAGSGHLLLLRTPDPNWPPTVDAGADRTVTFPSDTPVELRASADDVDHDWLRYQWRDASGATVGNTAVACLTLAPGEHRFTVTVDDGHAHVASDSVTITVTGGGGTGTVTVTAPTAGEVVHPDRLYTIRWTAPDMAAVTSYRVGVTYTRTGGTSSSHPCFSLPASARSCVWRPDLLGDNVRVTVEARGSGGVVASGMSGTFRVARAPGELPPGWLGADVGAVGLAGSGTQLESGAMVVRGAGADIWGTADAFHFVYQTFDGDGHGSIEISDVDGVHAWTKVGLMIRQSLDPGSPHHFVLASEGKGLAYQRRLTQGGTSLHTSLGTGPLPVTVHISRLGRRLVLSLSRNGTSQQVTDTEFPEGPVLIGLAVTSHDSTRLAAGRFDIAELDAAPKVAISAPAAGEVLQVGRPYEIRWTASDDHGVESVEVYSSSDDGVTWTIVCFVGEDIPLSDSCTWDNPGPATERGRIKVIVNGSRNDQAEDISDRFSIRPSGTPGSLPAGWSNHDIGAVGAAGHATHTSATGMFTVEGSGADVWGTADEFHYAHRPASGNFEVTARVASIENLHRWVKAGLMIREHLGAGARHAFAIATPRTERGVVFQRRASEGGLSTSNASVPVAPPVWLRVVRTGDTVQAFYRTSSTAAWVSLGQQTFTALARDLHVGLAVTSHVDGQLATATFDNFSIRALP